MDRPTPEQSLARLDGHAATGSTVVRCTDKFWRLMGIADTIRDLAGRGFSSFPNGAPRSCAVYRNWRLFHERELEYMNVTSRLRLWWATVNGLEPGVWRPDEVDSPTKEENTFAGRLERLGEPPRRVRTL